MKFKISMRSRKVNSPHQCEKRRFSWLRKLLNRWKGKHARGSKMDKLPSTEALCNLYENHTAGNLALRHPMNHRGLSHPMHEPPTNVLIEYAGLRSPDAPFGQIKTHNIQPVVVSPAQAQPYPATGTWNDREFQRLYDQIRYRHMQDECYPKTALARRGLNKNPPPQPAGR